MRGVGPGGRNAVVEMTEGRPDREDERVEGLAAEPCLCAVPNAGHDSAVQRTPYAEYRAEGGTNIRREDDVVLRPGVGVGGEEEAGERVADPDGEPTLPPGHAQGNAGRGDHERVDIERVSNPECKVVDCGPFPLLRRDGKKVAIRPERRRSTVWLAEFDRSSEAFQRRHPVQSEELRIALKVVADETAKRRFRR